MHNSLALLSALLLASCVAASPMPTAAPQAPLRRQVDVDSIVSSAEARASSVEASADAQAQATGSSVSAFLSSVKASGTTTAFDTQNTGSACDRVNFDNKCCHSGVVIDDNCYANVQGFTSGAVAGDNNGYAYIDGQGNQYVNGDFSVTSDTYNGKSVIFITDNNGGSSSSGGNSGKGNTFGPGQSCDSNGNGCNFGGSDGDGDSSSASASPASSVSQSAANTVAAQTTSTSGAGSVQASASSSDSGSSSSSKKPLGGSNGAPSLQSGAQAATALIVAAIAGAFAI